MGHPDIEGPGRGMPPSIRLNRFHTVDQLDPSGRRLIICVVSFRECCRCATAAIHVAHQHVLRAATDEVATQRVFSNPALW